MAIIPDEYKYEISLVPDPGDPNSSRFSRCVWDNALDALKRRTQEGELPPGDYLLHWTAAPVCRDGIPDPTGLINLEPGGFDIIYAFEET